MNVIAGYLKLKSDFDDMRQSSFEGTIASCIESIDASLASDGLYDRYEFLEFFIDTSIDEWDFHTIGMFHLLANGRRSGYVLCLNLTRDTIVVVYKTPNAAKVMDRIVLNDLPWVRGKILSMFPHAVVHFEAT